MILTLSQIAPVGVRNLNAIYEKYLFRSFLPKEETDPCGRFFLLIAELRPSVADIRAEAAFALAKLADCAYRHRRYLAMRGDITPPS